MIIRTTLSVILIFMLSGCISSSPPQKSQSTPTETVISTVSPTITPAPSTTPYLTPTTTPVPFINISLLPPGEYFTEQVSLTGKDIYLAIFSAKGKFKGFLAKVDDADAQLSPNLKYLVDTYYVTDLSTGEKTAFNSLKGCTSAHWAPDNKHLVTSCPTSDTTSTGNVDSLYVFSLDDQSMTQITYSPYPKNSNGARWSPDGKWIAYEGVEARSGDSAYNGVHILDTKCFNKPSTCWHDDIGISLRGPLVWSPDGRYLAGIYSNEFRIFQIQNGTAVLIKSFSEGSEAYWLWWLPDGNQLAILTNDGYFLRSVATGELSPLTIPPTGTFSQLGEWFMVP